MNKLKVLLMVSVLLVFVSGCSGGGEVISGGNVAEGPVITVYKTALCGCCVGWVAALKDAGYTVKTVEMEDLTEFKEPLGIPQNMRSCHTGMVGDYFIEGHVPMEAVAQLIAEQPDIDGITLPNMPSGSPGMPGEKRGPFVVYSIKDGVSTEFMRI
tara:strand:+ start:115 stop:582 length:468 start_codon:yes stop_codon:yes gene_type:complete